jgi:hypothetical protein
VVGRGGGDLVSGLVLGVLGNALIAHISNITGLGISNLVGDDLGPAVGKLDAVGSTGGIPVALLVLAKVDLGVVVGNGVVVVVGSRLIVLRLLIGGPWGVRGGRVVGQAGRVGAGNGHKGCKSDDELKDKHILHLVGIRRTVRIVNHCPITKTDLLSKYTYMSLLCKIQCN